MHSRHTHAQTPAHDSSAIIAQTRKKEEKKIVDINYVCVTPCLSTFIYFIFLFLSTHTFRSSHSLCPPSHQPNTSFSTQLLFVFVRRVSFPIFPFLSYARFIQTSALPTLLFLHFRRASSTFTHLPPSHSTPFCLAIPSCIRTLYPSRAQRPHQPRLSVPPFL